MNHASLETGIGGFDLAAEWMGWINVFQCEIDSFCNKLLAQNFPNTIKHGDIRTTDFSIYRGQIDVLSAGFPCQPYSTAGKRLGKADERHLWPENYRAVREIQPPWVVGENVRGLTNWNGGLVFDEVQADLEAAGYEVTPFLLPAAGVNAPHRRERIFFIAYSCSNGQQRASSTKNVNGGGIEERMVKGYESNPLYGDRITTDPRCIFGNGGQGVESGEGVNNGEDIGRKEKADVDQRLYQTGIDTNAESLTEREQTDEINTESAGGEAWPFIGCSCESSSNSNYQGLEEQQCERRDNGQEQPTTQRNNNWWQDWPTQPGICRGDDGLPNRVHRLKGLGNAVVPQVVLQIFKAIQAYEDLKQ